MVHIGYCGENLEDFKVKGDSGLGFPGIFFYYGYSDAKKLAEANGGKVYIAECDLGKIKENRSGLRLFDSLSDVMVFINNYLSSWVGSDGLLLDSKRKEVNSMLSTYPGHYDLVKAAAEANSTDVADILNGLGVNSIVMPYGFAITSPTQILSYQEVDHQLTNEEVEVENLPAEESIGEAGTYAAFETKSNDYIRKAKHGKPYKTKPGNRFIRRVRIRTNGGNSTWFDIDINRLFKKSSFAVKVPVIGETSEYTCTISFEDWLPKLKADILANGFTQLTVKKSLAEMMRFNDLKVRCSCPDFTYRHAYWLTVNGDIEGNPELRPSNITNPKDDLGGICKHLSLCLNNKWTYFDKVSRIIYNYFINLERSQKALFDRVVAPKLGLDELRKREEEAASKAAENDSVDQVEKELEDGIKQDQAIQPEPQVEEEQTEQGPDGVTEEEPETPEEPVEPVEEEGEPV